jgi:glucose-6-phosphate dehydrogenase assembly protein OpcA
MPDTRQLETFAAGVETAVDVAQVERQLRELWQVAAESEKDPTRRTITRASLFNLVAYCETDADRDHATETIGTLTSRHPCRAIVVFAEPSESRAELSASITAHCHVAGGGRKQVCCEQISIHALGERTGQLGSAVLPLLESDLPTILWWQGNFLETPELFDHLLVVADRVVFHTSQWPDGPSGLASLHRVVAEHQRCIFTDLSWTRLGIWRKLTAECFDDPPARAELDRVRSVEIVHGKGAGARLRATLYAAWLAAQLSWRPAAALKRIHFTPRDDPDASETGIISVELKSPDATFSLRKSFGEWAASATAIMPQVCNLPRKQAFAPNDDASLLSQVFDQPGPDHVYERALAMAAKLADKL